MQETELKSAFETGSSSRRIEALYETWKLAMRTTSRMQKIYNEYLTRVDQAHAVPSLDESASVIRELQKTINALYDISGSISAESAVRFSARWWKNVLSPRWWARKWLQNELKPLLQQQKEWNATTVHLQNELVEYLSGSTRKMRLLLEEQILFFQQITPWIDVKIQELRQEQNHSMALNLGKLADLFQAVGSSSSSFVDGMIAQFNSLESQLNEKSLANERRLQEMWFQLNRQRAAQPDFLPEAVDVKRIHAELEELRNQIEKLIPVDGKYADKEMVRKAGTDFPIARDFRYYAFEEVFRGASLWIMERLKEYVPFFVTGPTPILDIGCGRGEFLQLMKELGKEAYGIEINQYDVNSLTQKGFKVVQEDLLAHLMALKPESTGGVFCAQVIEHLSPEVTYQMLARLQVVMKPGSALVVETVNPLSVFGYHHVYFKDPTHIFPVHPKTLAFMMKYAGFTNIQVHEVTPVPDNEKLNKPAGINHVETHQFLDNMVTRLNDLLYSNLEYYIVGYRP